MYDSILYVPFVIALVKILLLVAGTTVAIQFAAVPFARLCAHTRRWGRHHIAELVRMSDEELCRRYGPDAAQGIVLIVAD